MALLFSAQPANAQQWFVIDGGRGPVHVYIPSNYSPFSPAPLGVFLHAYGWTVEETKAYFQLETHAEEYGAILLLPEGSRDGFDNPFWNATVACCDFWNTGIDDSQYLRSLIEGMQTNLNINPARIHVAGLSNGGFMAHRMACDHADLIAGIANISGSTYFDPSLCQPSRPVHVLEIRATADPLILYEGGLFVGSPYPGAIDTAEQSAVNSGCSLVYDDDFPALDFDAAVPGSETLTRRYADGCWPHGSVTLWTVEEGGHVPDVSENAMSYVSAFFHAHPQVPLWAGGWSGGQPGGSWPGPDGDGSGIDSDTFDYLNGHPQIQCLLESGPYQSCMPE
jgi:polyhydroxybutyrate depolymerase